jgi:adenylate cyclase
MILATVGIVLGLVAAGTSAGAFEALRARATDAVFPRGVPDHRVTVVGIDTASLAATGDDWPWPRTRLAELVRRLADSGARVVVLDLTLAADRGREDDALIAAMAQVPTVLASFPSQSIGYDRDLDVRTVDPTTMVTPSPRIAAAAASVGHAAVITDSYDGVVRDLPVVLDNGTDFIPSLALAALSTAQGLAPEQLVLRPSSVQVGTLALPVGPRHELKISYSKGFAGPELGDHLISAIDVIDGLVPARLLRNRTVLVGVTDRGLGDHVLTPLVKGGAGQPGVSVHASALSTMLGDTYLRPINDRETLVVSGLLVFGVATATLFVGIVAGAFAGVSFLVGLFAIAFGPRASSGRLLDVVYPSLALLVAFVVAALLRYLVSDRQRRRATQLFRQYVPTKVSDELLARGLLDDAVAGMRVEVTTMFCDLRGFTAMTHELGPQELRAILDHYYDYAVNIVERHDGTLMQFVGDEVYAVFGAPLPSADHAERAIRCGLDLVQEIAKLDATLRANNHRTIRFGVGVATGEAIAAHVGSRNRRQYTVVGDAVNLGARLCSQARAGDLVVAAKAAECVSLGTEPTLREALELKGFDEPYPVWRFSEREGSRNEPRETTS